MESTSDARAARPATTNGATSDDERRDQRRPCRVELCPALAAPRSPYCVGHKTAKKLPAVQKGRTCAKCDRVLHEGDYVTRESTAARIVHAVCPRDVPRKPARRKGETPLLHAAVEHIA